MRESRLWLLCKQVQTPLRQHQDERGTAHFIYLTNGPMNTRIRCRQTRAHAHRRGCVGECQMYVAHYTNKVVHSSQRTPTESGRAERYSKTLPPDFTVIRVRADRRARKKGYVLSKSRGEKDNKDRETMREWSGTERERASSKVPSS